MGEKNIDGRQSILDRWTDGMYIRMHGEKASVTFGGAWEWHSTGFASWCKSFGFLYIIYHLV